MAGGDPLDDWLSSRPKKVHRKVKRLLQVVREAYPIGVPALIVKSQTDRLGVAAGHAFHLGTPDDVLRRICSWLLTNGEDGVLTNLVPALWRRHGREDVALAGLLLPNLVDVNDDDAWDLLAESMGEREAAESLLLTIEEMFRAERAGPGDVRVLAWCQDSIAHSHLALLVTHVEWVRNDRAPLSDGLSAAFEDISLPDGDSLLGRIRDRMCPPEAKG